MLLNRSIENDYNCIYSADGKKLEQFGNNPYSGGHPAERGRNSLKEDPLVDAEFMPRNKNVLIGGKKNLAGNRGIMGAVSQEHQFVGRSKKSNPGRFGIIR